MAKETLTADPGESVAGEADGEGIERDQYLVFNTMGQEYGIVADNGFAVTNLHHAMHAHAVVWAHARGQDPVVLIDLSGDLPDRRMGRVTTHVVDMVNFATFSPPPARDQFLSAAGRPVAGAGHVQEGSGS